MSQAKGKKPNTAAVCAELAAPVAQRLGVYLWDVAFEKEGAGWYLRYFIDRDGDTPLSIDDCENFSRAVGGLLDQADPIEQSYTLEVGSPGVERKLTQGWHFRKYLQEQVLVHLIRPVDGERDFVGVLTDYNEETGAATVRLDEETSASFSPEETAYIRLYEEF